MQIDSLSDILSQPDSVFCSACEGPDSSLHLPKGALGTGRLVKRRPAPDSQIGICRQKIPDRWFGKIDDGKILQTDFFYRYRIPYVRLTISFSTEMHFDDDY